MEFQIAITATSNKAVFGVVGITTLTDLCAVGTQQASRVIPRLIP